MKKPSIGFIVSMLLIGALCVGFVYLGAGSSADNFFHTRRGREHLALTAIATAVRSYQEEFLSEPPIPAEAFFATLRGRNPKEITFLSSPRIPDSESGIRCDTWNSPYQVFFGEQGWLIRSAGPNRVFDDLANKDSDDITIIAAVAHKKKQNKSEMATPRKPSD